MRRLLMIAATAGALALAGWAVASNTVAAGATTHAITVPVATFVQLPSSTHNSPATQFCGSQVAPIQGVENNGTLTGGAGSYLAALSLPDGATVTGLTFALRDNDVDINAAAYLNRKNISAGLMFLGAFVNMAQVQSSGASDPVRQFSTTTINQGLVNNSKFTYFLEVVNCGDTVEPIGVRVTYTTP
jgi:hypothetical protein